MSRTFTRSWVHPELKIHDLQTGVVTTRSEFDWMIDRWKVIMQDKYNVVPGQTCLLWFQRPNIYYCSALFAAIELGLILVSDMPHAYSHDDLSNYKIAVHGKIDLAIVDRASQDSSNVWDMIVYYRTCKNILFDYDFDSYIIQRPELATARKLQQISDANLALWQIPTSGTTGPAILDRRSHAFQLALEERLMRVTNYTRGTGRALHICDLHEGVSLQQHFLAAFNACEHQYLLDNTHGTCINNVTSAVYKNKITHVSLHTPELLTEWVCQTPVIDWDITVNTMFQIPKDVVPLVNQKQINRIITSFGSVTLGGPVLIKTVTPDTSIDNYQINEFVSIDDGFYLYELRNEELWISIPSTGGKWVTGKDWFKFENGHYIFLGRTDIFHINNTSVSLQSLEDLTIKHFGYQATIATDLECEKIYLALWNNIDVQPMIDDLADLYPTLRINYIIRNEPKQRFWNGRKVDRNAIRDYCREKMLHSTTVIAYNTI